MKNNQNYLQKLACLFFLACATFSHAEPNWVFLGRIPDGSEAYIDTLSIESIDDQTKSFRGKTKFAHPVEGVSSVLAEIVLQCNTKVAEIHSLSFFSHADATGEPINRVDYEIPDFISFDESEADLNTLKRVCFPE